MELQGGNVGLLYSERSIPRLREEREGHMASELGSSIPDAYSDGGYKRGFRPNNGTRARHGVARTMGHNSFICVTVKSKNASVVVYSASFNIQDVNISVKS